MYAFIILILFLILDGGELEGLHRDNVESPYFTYLCPNCLFDLKSTFVKIPSKDVDKNIHLIPHSRGKTCQRCNCLFGRLRDGIYVPYIYREYYFEFLEDYLNYCSDNKSCQCYWPEVSKQAAEINDTAYGLFFDLFETTLLRSKRLEIAEFMELFTKKTASDDLTRHIVTGIVSKCFFFSHYCKLCHDLDQYSKITLDVNDYGKIFDKLESIKFLLGKMFVQLFEVCLCKHKNKRIVSEKVFASKFFEPELFGLLIHEQNGIDKFVDLEILSKKPIDWLAYQILFDKGVLLNDLYHHHDAIEVLTKVINGDPSNRDAYIERALAYFETNQIGLALKDYEAAKKLRFDPPFRRGQHGSCVDHAYKPENKIEFSKGMILGALEGINESAANLIPYVVTGCRGIVHGLWAFVASPEEIIQDMVNAAYSLGEFVRMHSTKECGLVA